MKPQIYQIINFNQEYLMQEAGQSRSFFVTDELIVAAYLEKGNFRAFTFPQNIEIQSYDLTLNQGIENETT